MNGRISFSSQNKRIALSHSMYNKDKATEISTFNKHSTLLPKINLVDNRRYANNYLSFNHNNKQQISFGDGGVFTIPVACFLLHQLSKSYQRSKISEIVEKEELTALEKEKIAKLNLNEANNKLYGPPIIDYSKSGLLELGASIPLNDAMYLNPKEPYKYANVIKLIQLSATFNASTIPSVYEQRHFDESNIIDKDYIDKFLLLQNTANKEYEKQNCEFKIEQKDIFSNIKLRPVPRKIQILLENPEIEQYKDLIKKYKNYSSFQTLILNTPKSNIPALLKVIKEKEKELITTNVGFITTPQGFVPAELKAGEAMKDSWNVLTFNILRRMIETDEYKDQTLNLIEKSNKEVKGWIFEDKTILFPGAKGDKKSDVWANDLRKLVVNYYMQYMFPSTINKTFEEFNIINKMKKHELCPEVIRKILEDDSINSELKLLAIRYREQPQIVRLLNDTKTHEIDKTLTGLYMKESHLNTKSLEELINIDNEDLIAGIISVQRKLLPEFMSTPYSINSASNIVQTRINQYEGINIAQSINSLLSIGMLIGGLFSLEHLSDDILTPEEIPDAISDSTSNTDSEINTESNVESGDNLVDDNIISSHSDSIRDNVDFTGETLSEKDFHKLDEMKSFMENHFTKERLQGFGINCISSGIPNAITLVKDLNESYKENGTITAKDIAKHVLSAAIKTGTAAFITEAIDVYQDDRMHISQKQEDLANYNKAIKKLQNDNSYIATFLKGDYNQYIHSIKNDLFKNDVEKAFLGAGLGIITDAVGNLFKKPKNIKEEIDLAENIAIMGESIINTCELAEILSKDEKEELNQNLDNLKQAVKNKNNDKIKELSKEMRKMVNLKILKSQKLKD